MSKIYYDDNNVLVDSIRYVSEGSTYPIANIKGVYASNETPNNERSGDWFEFLRWLFFGSIAAFFGYRGLQVKLGVDFLEWILYIPSVIAVILFVLALMERPRVKKFDKVYGVRMDALGGEYGKATYHNADNKIVHDIVAAINEAIIARG